MKTFILITALLSFMAHTASAQYNMTPPIPLNYNSQMYYTPNQNLNYSSNPQVYDYQNLSYRNNNQPGYGYNSRYSQGLITTMAMEGKEFGFCEL